MAASMARPIQTSDIIFPVLSSNLSETLSSLKRSALSITNRLRSIAQDAEFVCSVAEAYGLPLVANERCGSWYIPPDRKGGSAYFKSTDGHAGEWSFSLRRLNTQVLDIVGRRDGCVIVDSTRRGKNMPDALSKTVPIWCAVLNRVLFPDQPEAHALYTPPQTVSPSEHSQIEARLDSFVRQLKELNLSTSDLRDKISKPLRPLWVTQTSELPDSPPSFEDFHLVVLCTSSRRVRGGEVSEGGYIQGAGDDSESWACGLTAPLFWANKEQLMSTAEEDLPETIASLMKGASHDTPSDITLIKPTTGLYVGSLDSINSANIGTFDGIITCSEKPDSALQGRLKSRYLHLHCGPGKLGSRDLRKELPKLEPFITSHAPFENLLICCATGKDLSLGVALATICLFANTTNGTLTNQPTTAAIDKSSIRQRLAWITTSLPTANPSRATLQSINLYLIRPAAAAPPAPSIPKAVLSSDPAPPNLTQPPAASAPSRTSLIFAALAGAWSIHRTLTSVLPTHPSGTFAGVASFTPRPPSAPGFDAEYLYAEDGTFKTATGLEFEARRAYVYRHCGARDEASVWFAEGERGAEAEAGGLFVELEAEAEEGKGADGEGKVMFVSKAVHLCGEDAYGARYVFGLKDERKEEGESGMGWFETGYDVKGPRKYYTSRARYERKVME